MGRGRGMGGMLMGTLLEKARRELGGGVEFWLGVERCLGMYQDWADWEVMV